MSDAATEDATCLNLSGVVARIDRQQAETRKFLAEQSRLMAAQAKLMAEAERLRWGRFLAPALALAATLGAMPPSRL